MKLNVSDINGKELLQRSQWALCIFFMLDKRQVTICSNLSKKELVEMDENGRHYLQMTCINYEQASMLKTLLLIQ